MDKDEPKTTGEPVIGDDKTARVSFDQQKKRKIDKIETEIGALAQRADSTAFVGEGLKSVQEEVSNFKQNVFDKTNSIEQKISSVSDTLKRQDESTIEFHKKSERLFQELVFFCYNIVINLCCSFIFCFVIY